MDRPAAGKALLWALLAIPAMLIVRRYMSEAELWPGDLLGPTGEWSARLIVLALMLTPLSMLLPRAGWVQWLVRHRRAFGVAAFGYALLHLALYVLDMETVRNILAEVGAPAIWTAWLAFFCLLPMALTSNNASMRLLKRSWKRLQRLAYPAAILTLIHWILVHDGRTEALVTFAPLAALTFYRLARSLSGRAPSPRKLNQGVSS